jgi:hypothetical protein
MQTVSCTTGIPAASVRDEEATAEPVSVAIYLSGCLYHGSVSCRQLMYSGMGEGGGRPWRLEAGDMDTHTGRRYQWR